ncbi:MAG: hypothetical protein IPL61_10575 [Myxococcales bacterium]|nr:hypothetical protein [Myxococcales bacterium]
MRTRSIATVLALTFGLGLAVTTDDAWAKGRRKKPVPVKKGPAEQKVPPPNAEQKKALGELMGAYKFGMDKDEIIGTLAKQIDERFAEQISATSDVMSQDKLRKEKQKEIQRIKQSYIAFDGKKSGWDVSLIDSEFAHKTGESMLAYWENAGGKNQKRFFFFYEGKLWKMFVAIDTKALADDQRNFTFFRGLMESRYGKAKTVEGRAVWNATEFEVQAVDKMAFYGSFGLLIQDPKLLVEVQATRKANAPEAKKPDAIIEVIREKGNDSDKVNLDENSDAVDAIINGSKGK